MTLEEKKVIIADILEIDENEVVEEGLLSSFEAWDSVAVLSIISEVERATGKYVHADDIKKLKTIEDIMNLLEA